MSSQKTAVTCPNCNTEFDIEGALTSNISKSIREQLNKEYNSRFSALKKEKEEEMEMRLKALKEEQKRIEEESIKTLREK
jgi:hypothetical protein